MINVIIPTYKEPDALELCLKSAITGQRNKNNIIVVCDGTYNINATVIDNYKDYINVIAFDENYGLPRATNIGVYNSIGDNILIVNDDNVFDNNWDIKLEQYNIDNTVISINQIEPYDSMFKQFHIYDMGRTPTNFNLNDFWDYTNNINTDKIENTGSTLPIYMSRINYLKVGGWDETYPGPWVVDWDFFLKCNLCGMNMARIYNLHFYHFVSIGTRTPEKIASNQLLEHECHEFAYYKWGKYIKHNLNTNLKFI